MKGCDAKRQWAFDCMSGYWPGSHDALFALDIPTAPDATREELPPKLAEIALPDWAADLGVRGTLVIPARFLLPGPEVPHSRVDWLGAAAWYLDGLAERTAEAAGGPLHSYAFRLRGWDGRMWDHAWVNRIALFLRRAASRRVGRDETELFGPLPAPQIVLTHDVDAVRKTAAVRIKQSAFHAINSLRHAWHADGGAALDAAAQSVAFAFSRGDYWCFDEIRRLEEQHDLTSHFNVFATPEDRRRGPRQALLDPAYRVDDRRLTMTLRALHRAGWTIGLHQSFDAWADADRMSAERRVLEAAIEVPVRSCRQHWLRFSWEKTWKAQQKAGLELDTTLGFNDRPGFRNGAALAFPPWDSNLAEPMRLCAIPMVLMDSHLYDYRPLEESARHREIPRWIDEIRAVGGTASVIWHQRVMSRDYGWGEGYRQLVSEVARSAA